MANADKGCLDFSLSICKVNFIVIVETLVPSAEAPNNFLFIYLLMYFSVITLVLNVFSPLDFNF